MERFHRLAHSVWDCKYHVVWIPKYRRKELYGEKRGIVVDTIKQWARIKGIEIIEGHAMPDHIHLCVSTAQVFGRSHHRTVERKKRLGGDEFRKQEQPNGPRSDILGEGLLRQHSRP